MTNDDNDQRPFDLEERTARSGETVIDLLKKVPRGPVTEFENASAIVGVSRVDRNIG